MSHKRPEYSCPTCGTKYDNALVAKQCPKTAKCIGVCTEEALLDEGLEFLPITFKGLLRAGGAPFKEGVRWREDLETQEKGLWVSADVKYLCIAGDVMAYALRVFALQELSRNPFFADACRSAELLHGDKKDINKLIQGQYDCHREELGLAPKGPQ